MARRLRLLAAVLSAFVIAGCTGGSGTSPGPAGASVAVTTAPVTVYTPDDEAIARFVQAGVGEAVPQLKVLNDSDPSKLEDLFLPLGAWISSQVTGMARYTPSVCTADAVELFLDGMGRYDDIRKQFLAWRDWGANGNAFSPAAPGLAASTLEEAVTELKATCTE